MLLLQRPVAVVFFAFVEQGKRVLQRLPNQRAKGQQRKHDILVLDDAVTLQFRRLLDSLTLLRGYCTKLVYNTRSLFFCSLILFFLVAVYVVCRLGSRCPEVALAF